MPRHHEEKPKKVFKGYQSPNYTMVPDELFDEHLPELSGAELKVLLYIVRRTFGFKRESDTISLSQLLAGITTRDGRVLDRGTGLSKKTLLEALRSLEERNLIFREQRRSAERGDEPTSYRLNVVTGTRGEETTPPVGEKLHHGGGGEIPPGPWGKNSPTQETVRQQTDIDPSNFERSHDYVDNGKRTSRSDEAYTTLGELVAQHQLNRSGSTPQTKGETNGRRTGTAEEREEVTAFLSDFAREFNDEAQLSSSVTRAIKLFKQAGAPRERWGDYLYQARAITKEYTGSIRKTATAERGGFVRKNKAPYFFEVLSDLLGLREESSATTRTE